MAKTKSHSTCGGDMKQLPGGSWYCPPCKSKSAKKYYKNNRDVVRAKNASYLYGVTVEQALEMRTQDGCDVCGESSETLNIDHDHRTGKVRGLLCRKCNVTLGNVDDDPERLRALAKYLEDNRG